MRGTVKWFSTKRGYGFIVGQDEIDYHVSVRDVSGVTLPANGDTVEFEVTQGKRASRATRVTVVQRAASARQPVQATDDRVVCASCQRRMVPRMISYRGEPRKSVCPFCGTTYQKFGGFLRTHRTSAAPVRFVFDILTRAIALVNAKAARINADRRSDKQ
ncbi:cold-shock protein [Paraburkholderia fungorum]|uniref:cold-shock protein n=1 Tax=Paraburkholderia fungorum TaxID=134537 RepID=UPI0038B93423